MNPAAPSTPIAILGFSEFERQALLSYLQIGAARRAVRYFQVLNIDDAHFVVAEGDQSSTVALLEALDRIGDTVFVGGQAPQGAAAWLMRPFTPEAVLRELDDLTRRRERPDAAALPLGLPRELDSDFAPLDGLRPVPAEPLVNGRRADDRLLAPPRAAAPPSARGATARMAAPAPTAASVAAPVPSASLAPSSPLAPLARSMPSVPPAASPSTQPLPARALVLDDSAIAQHFLRRLLTCYGLEVDVVGFSQQALELLSKHSYGVVFLDVDLGEGARYEGLKLCHRIRHQFAHPAGHPPMVVMVSAFHDPVDQVRGTLAGAEVFLGKPLDLHVLDQLMRRLGYASAGPRRPAPGGQSAVAAPLMR